MRRRAPAEAQETLPRLSWRARFLTIGIGGSVDGERPRDGTCAGDKNARPGVSKGRFWRIVFSNPSRAGALLGFDAVGCLGSLCARFGA
jgi:hypothetical protein